MKIPGANSMPFFSASACPSRESSASIDIKSGNSTERRSSIAMAESQNAQFSCVSRRMRSVSIALLGRLRQSPANVGEKVRHGDIHGVLGSTAVVGPPTDSTIGAYDDKAVTVAALSHH